MFLGAKVFFSFILYIYIFFFFSYLFIYLFFYLYILHLFIYIFIWLFIYLLFQLLPSLRPSNDWLFLSSCFLRCTAAYCMNCTQEMVFSPMWSVTSYSTSLKHCQLCVGPRPGSNCPIPALSLLVNASPVWLDKPCHGCFPLGPSSLRNPCLQFEWGLTWCAVGRHLCTRNINLVLLFLWHRWERKPCSIRPWHPDSTGGYL